MTKTEHIEAAFTAKQMELLADLAIKEMIRRNKQGERKDEELEEAFVLLNVAAEKQRGNV